MNTDVYIYVCKEHLCSRRKPYSLDCHGGAVRMYCARENITDFNWAQNWVSDGDGSWTVGGSEFQRAGPEYAKLLCPYRFVLQYEKTRLPCAAECKWVCVVVAATGMYDSEK